MPDITSTLKLVFAGLVALYVCVHVALTIFEVRSEEASANVVPAAFRRFISLAEHRKAVDYTGEIIQCDLVSALLCACIAVLLTYGSGFSVLLAGVTTLFGQGIAAEFALLGIVLAALTIIDFPVSWWKEFKINERYGFERTPPMRWFIERLKEIALGAVGVVPLLLGATVILMSASYWWWAFVLILNLIWFVWRFILAPNWLIGFSSQARPMPEGSLKDCLTALLRQTGWQHAEICVARRPAHWRHGHALLAKRGGRARLVIFEHVLERLTDEEVTAIAAAAIGRVDRWHNIARLTFFSFLACVFWWGLAWLAQKPYFYRALNIEPALAIPNGTVNPALLFCIVIVLVPVILYPLVFVVHAFTRMLKFDEDAYAVRVAGAKPLVRALAKLHRDYRMSLTPNPIYSLANHRRPHVTQRISVALMQKKRDSRHYAHAAHDEQKTRAMLFNNIIDKRRTERDERLRQRVQLKSERLREASNLRSRGFSLQQG